MVEPDVEAAGLLRRMFERAGYGVVMAASGEQALDLARQRPYAAITLDLQLPDIGGAELIGQLHALKATARTPIVVI